MKHQSSSSLGKICSENTRIKKIGKATLPNPAFKKAFELYERRVLYYPFASEDPAKMDLETTFEVAGSAPEIYFDPVNVRAGVVTCGGICPGLNSVIRAITLCLYHNYGATKIFGFRYGFQGLNPEYHHRTLELGPENVSTIHGMGGSILGTSRGEQDIGTIVDTLDRMSLNQLYVIGGDGTLKAAHLIAKEVLKRNLKVAVIGVPKTIDNDICFVSESFGFNTAVEIATNAIRCAHVEALSHPNGVGLVKLMGRHSGFIAATAAVAQRDANFVLIPEKKFCLDGPNGLLETLRKRLERKGHVVVVVAEGAGQEFFGKTERDGFGHVKFNNIGIHLKNSIVGYFDERKIPLNLKYIDPSYLIRSVPPNTYDNLFSAALGQNAVHAAMRGNTDMIVSSWHGVYCHVPLDIVIRGSKSVDLNGRLWLSVLESTGQPDFDN